MRKYRMFGGMGYPVQTEMDVYPIPGLSKHLELPKNPTKDIIAFTAKYVESYSNANRVYFDNEELVKAYDTISFKAIDIEHEVEAVVGHIYSHVFVDRSHNKALSYDELIAMDVETLRKTPLDIIIGSVVYADRFPQLESPMTRKAWAISMETYFSDFDILLENGLRLSQEEASAVGLSNFIDQLMGSFDSFEDFEAAHSLMVTTAANTKETLKVFKYLKELLFSGGGLVAQPACKSCHVLTTSLSCPEPVKAAAAELFSLDLRKVDSYMQAIRDSQYIGPVVFQVKAMDEECECAEELPPAPPNDNPPQGVTTVPSDYTKKPAPCPQYQVDENMWCTYADKQCVTAGDRSFKDCYRWSLEEDGQWSFDTKSVKDGMPDSDTESEGPGEEESAMDDVVIEETLNKAAASLAYVIASAEYALQAWDAKKQSGAVWNTQYINNLPNSSFAVVETGYKEGMNKNARHLPFKDKDGNVDPAHLRNALARVNQVKSVLGNDSDEELRSRAQRKLGPYSKRLQTNKGD